MNNQVKIHSLQDTRVLSIRYTGQYKEINEYVKLLFELAKERIDGAPFVLYYDIAYNEEADIEVCLPVSEEIGMSDPFHNKIIAGGEFATILHKGNYKTLPEGYRAIETFLSEREIPIGVPSREIYLVGSTPTKEVDTKDYLTQIAIPLPTNDEEI